MVLEAQKPIPTCQQVLVSCQDLLPGLQMAVSSHGGARSSLSISYKALTPFTRAPPSWPNYVPEILPSDSIMFGIRASVWGLEDANIQSIASFLLSCKIRIIKAWTHFRVLFWGFPDIIYIQCLSLSKHHVWQKSISAHLKYKYSTGLWIIILWWPWYIRFFTLEREWFFFSLNKLFWTISKQFWLILTLNLTWTFCSTVSSGIIKKKWVV